LGKNVDGPPASGQVNYASVIGMLLYLGHSRPDIAFATHQCACYTFAPKQLHEDALKRIGRYLKVTLTKGLILRPSDDLNIDCYPDANFAGLWNRDNTIIHIVSEVGQVTLYVSQFVKLCGLVYCRLKLCYQQWKQNMLH
jgi:hypothetical protein